MNKQFLQKSKTFVLRCYWNFWNSESSSEAYTKLFKIGFKDETLQDFAIGWNHKPITRSLRSFGFEDGKITIPEGIVIPYLVDKEVYGFKVFSLSFDEIFTMPESRFTPHIFNNNSGVTVVVQTEIDGFLMVQDMTQKANIIILTGCEPDIETIGLLEKSKKILIEEKLKNKFKKITLDKYFFNSFEMCKKIMDSV